MGSISGTVGVVGLALTLLGLLTVAYVLIKAGAAKARNDFQAGALADYQASDKLLRQQKTDAEADNAKLRAENAFMREVVTSKHEIESLKLAEDAHHAEIIEVLREIREAIRRD